uniref:PML C-terminal domain-containing protein n=1 Tax=Magallana gigas TaxID=29159 RepID=A0A8W8MID8_MAGGI
MHPLSIKRQSEEEVGRILDMVVPHIFGDHNLCSTSWCAYHRNPKSYRMKYLPNDKPLNDEIATKTSTTWLLVKHQRTAEKLIAYGGTTSLASRVSAAVLQKNEGYTYINQVNEDALLSPGVVSKLHGIRMDKEKLWNKKQQSSIAFKRRRLLLKKRKQKREYSLHLREGNTYGSNIETAAEVDIESIPGKLDPEKGECIMFDIETTGLSRDSDIVQLSAFDGITEFNKSFKTMVEKKAMSVATSRKIAGSGLGFRHIMLAHKRDELSGVKTLLGEHGMKGKVVSKMIEYLKAHEE